MLISFVLAKDTIASPIAKRRQNKIHESPRSFGMTHVLLGNSPYSPETGTGSSSS